MLEPYPLRRLNPTMTVEDAEIERRVRFGLCRRAPSMNYHLWHWFCMAGIRDYAVMLRMTSCRSRGPVAKLCELRLRDARR
jgi:hypothetical protein